MRNSVDFPQPDGPRSVTKLDGGTSKDNRPSPTTPFG